MTEYNDRRFVDLEPYENYADARRAAEAFPCGIAGCDGTAHEALDPIGEWSHRVATDEHVAGLVIETYVRADGSRFAAVRVQIEREMSVLELLEFADELSTAHPWIRAVALEQVAR